MIADLLPVYLRKIPPYLAERIASGDYKVFGSVIREVSTGQIRGFLQEAAPLAPMLGTPAAPLAIAKIAFQAGELVQGEVIRRGVARVESAVKNLAVLGVSNLALTGANLGVSVIGFSIMAVQINSLKRSVDNVADQIESVSAKIDQLQREAIETDFVEIESLSRAYDEGWHISDAAGQRRWHDVAQAALSLQSRFEMRAQRILAGGISQYSVADPFLDALSMTNALRVSALSACNEMTAAEMAAADGARSLERLTGTFGQADFARLEMLNTAAEPGSHGWSMAQAMANTASRDKASKIRVREAYAATRAAPLSEAENRGTSPRDALGEARQETTAPFLILAETTS